TICAVGSRYRDQHRFGITRAVFDCIVPNRFAEWNKPVPNWSIYRGSRIGRHSGGHNFPMTKEPLPPRSAFIQERKGGLVRGYFPKRLSPEKSFPRSYRLRVAAPDDAAVARALARGGTIRREDDRRYARGRPLEPGRASKHWRARSPPRASGKARGRRSSA